jgi:hypothetical protein
MKYASAHNNTCGEGKRTTARLYTMKPVRVMAEGNSFIQILTVS